MAEAQEDRRTVGLEDRRTGGQEDRRTGHKMSPKQEDLQAIFQPFPHVFINKKERKLI